MKAEEAASLARRSFKRVTNLEVIGVVEYLVTLSAGTVSLCPEFMVVKLIVVFKGDFA